MSIIEILNNINLTEESWNENIKRCSNWVELSDYLGEITDEMSVLCLLKVEIETKKRPTIINRLHGKYNRLRKDREMREIWQELSH